MMEMFWQPCGDIEGGEPCILPPPKVTIHGGLFHHSFLFSDPTISDRKT